MVLQILTLLETTAVLFGVPLLLYLLRERVKNIAREATERALADYTHQQKRDLESERTDHQRRLREFGLFTQKQHEVYAQAYRRFRIASDRFSNMIGLTLGPDFKRYNREDIVDYLKHREIKESAASEACHALEKGDAFAVGRAMDDLHSKANRRDAGLAFGRAKNYEAVNDLYFSDEVRSQLLAVRHTMAAVSVSLMRDEVDDFERQLKKKDEMEKAVSQLFDTMRAELRRGE